MSKNRRNFTAQQKADIVRRHLKDKVPVSTLAEELSVQPTLIYQWVTMALEQVDRLFDKTERGNKTSKRAQTQLAELKDRRIKKLEEKISYKNEVIAELMEENVKAKKANGDLSREFASVPIVLAHDVRDGIVDYMKYWTERAEVPCKTLLGWARLRPSKYRQWIRRYGSVNAHGWQDSS
jgi:transposase-like protein